MMRIGFLLPYYSERPIGGFKVVYEYGWRLAERGHEVVVIHPRSLVRGNLVEILKGIRWSVKRSSAPSEPFWFPHLQGMHFAFVPIPSHRWMPDCDAIVATGWRTAPWVASLPPSKGKKFYLIQHYETWDGPEDEVDATWRLPLHKIVIARWLYQLGREKFDQGDSMTYIPNGIDFSHLRETMPPDERSPYAVGMLYHKNPWKGTADGLRALEHVKKYVPELRVTLFGATPPGDDVPQWMEYLQLPSAEALLAFYNWCAVFVHPSWTEGWGLPAAEAMACGAALAAAANGGVLDYTEQGVTALLSEPRDSDALAMNILRLVRDQDLRVRIAKAGHDYIQRYTWDVAVSSLEHLLEDG